MSLSLIGSLSTRPVGTYQTRLVWQVTFILFALSVGSLNKSWNGSGGFTSTVTVGPGGWVVMAISLFGFARRYFL